MTRQELHGENSPRYIDACINIEIVVEYLGVCNWTLSMYRFSDPNVESDGGFSINSQLSLSAVQYIPQGLYFA